MQALKLHDQSMAAAARSRLASWRWRGGLGFIFGIGGSLALSAPLWGAIWFALLASGMAIDWTLGKRYLAAQTERGRQIIGWLFIFGCFLTNVAFVSMTISVGVLGGPDGRALSMLMAASSLVSGMLFLYRAPIFMFATMAPTLGWLIVSPIVPIGGEGSPPLIAGAAIACGTVGFLAYVWRSIATNTKMFAVLEEATATAKDRLAMAEARQAEAEEANRVKSEFLTTMTHELRTPLNAVIGYSEIIGEDMEAEGFKDLAHDATRITAAARHLLGLIDQILQLTTIDAGKSALELGEVDVRKLIDNAIAAVAGPAKENNNRLATRIAPDVALAFTDGDKLRVCVAHLLSNAVKFTNNGLVAVSAERETVDGRDWLRIAVSDTGIGMTREEIGKAFQPFTQIDGSQTRRQGGMGLGLSVTSRTSQVLGGEIAAVSEPGTGSTFTLRIPMRYGEGDPAFEQAHAHASIEAAA